MLAAIFLATMIPMQPPSASDRVVTKIMITPQSVPSPAFRYHLLPPLAEKTTGNAVQSYYRCMSPDSLAWYLGNKFPQRAGGWLELPYDEAIKKGRPHSLQAQPKKTEDEDDPPIPAASWEELAGITKMKLLDEIDVAARRTYAEWEYLEKIKQSGSYLMIPEITGFNPLGAILHLRARLLLMEGNYTRCLYTLQSGMAMARHLDETQIIMGTLVGNAVARAMTKVMFEWVQQPGSPNLYWALSDLPRPYFDLRKAFEGDRLATQNMIGDFTLLNQRILSVDEMSRMVEERLKPALRVFGVQQDVNFSVLVMREYPRAKTWLKEQGRSAEDIERMPATQAALLYAHWQHQHLADEYQKLFLLPPAERLKYVEKFPQELASRKNELSYYLGMVYFPSYPHIWLNVNELDRELAVLRCIEALRHYAAGHDKKLPSKWEDIPDLPIAVDPLSGERFGYQFVHDHVVITLAAIKGQKEWRQAHTYEIYVK